MFALSGRLRRSQDIQMVLRTGQRIHTALFEVALLPTRARESSRVAVVVGKRISLRATRRHRIQRQLRHLAREWVSQYPTGYDMVILARPASSQVQSMSDLKQGEGAVIQALQRILGHSSS